MSSARTSGAQPQNGDAKNRQHHDGSAGRAFTVEQKAAVIRIKRCAPTAYYEILGLEEVRKTASESEIKKAYRKLSLLTHPDKNGYEGADEAFKMVAKAFQILSDADKKATYDRYGRDPDARFTPGASSSSAGASPFSGFGRSSQGGPSFQEEMSPEDLFRQFFGGGGGGPFGGGIFDTGPAFVFNMGGGGPGVRVHQFGGGRPRRRPDTAAPAGSQPAPTAASALSSLLPLLFLFILPLLSSIFSSTSAPTGPSVIFDGPRTPHTQSRLSERLKVPYWVQPTEVEEFNSKKWRKLDDLAETKYIHSINVLCEMEHQEARRLELEAIGWGFFPDQIVLEKARKMEKKNCRKLREMGYQAGI